MRVFTKTTLVLGEKHLLVLCDAYCRTMRTSELTIGQRAGTDSRFFRRLRGGGSCTLRVYRRALQWFSDNWPCGVAWPAGIPRPKPSPGSLARKAA